MPDAIRMLQTKPLGARGAVLKIGADIAPDRAREVVALGWAEHADNPKAAGSAPERVATRTERADD